MSSEQSTILIVDDVAENIDILHNLLRERYKVKAARSGEQALKIARQEPRPDMVLLDIMMPEMDGYEVIKVLKADEGTREIPVIFISAKGETGDETLGFSLGAADYITKPVSPPIVLARVQTHLALHEKRQMLERRVEKETAKRLEQEKLLLRQSRLAAMGEMMSAITHQWNQPLSVISTASASLHISALMDGIEQEELLHELEVIDQSIRFMSQTMSDFKNYFRPDKIRRHFAVADEAAAIVSMLSPVMKSSNITVDMQIAPEVTGYGVPSEFKQVLLNLLGNAKDAIREKRSGEKTLQGRITLKGVRKGETCLLEISDNGIGIPEAMIGHIFDDYFTTKEEKGTGIGLSMSKMIIEEQMHGTIRAIDSKEGATFILEFPAHER